MPDLIYFLEKNGFYPRREDIEAILRRLDHDANKMLGFEEFIEIAGPDSDHAHHEEHSGHEDHDHDHDHEDEESKDAHQFDRHHEEPLRKHADDHEDFDSHEEH
jgi:hypothetical protein